MGDLSLCCLSLENTAAAGGGGGGSGNVIFTTVVTNDAELATALTTDGGDTFIQAGAYTIDTDAVGAMDTTPRRFVGAGRQGQGTGPFAGPGVIIEFIGAGGSITALDFSAGLTEAEGVEFENVSLFSSTASLSAFLVGLYSAKNLNLNGGSVSGTGITSSRNLVNCSFVNGSAAGFAFGFCDTLTNCTVGSTTAGEGAQTGFFLCEDLTNCQVVYEAGAIGSFLTAFFSCDNMSSCRADYAGVTGATSCTVLSSCTNVNGFVGVGPTVGVLAGIVGASACTRLSNVTMTGFAGNFTGSTQLSNCTSTHGVGTATGPALHFVTSNDLVNCRAVATGDPAVARNTFDTCDVLTNCRAIDSTDDGFSQCDTLTGCWSVGAATHGFDGCSNLAGCRSATSTVNGFTGCVVVAGATATTSGGDGFNGCTHLSACRVLASTGFDYAAINSNVSNCTGDAAGAGLSDASNLVVDPVTAAGI